jgi:hypothetical protein
VKFRARREIHISYKSFCGLRPVTSPFATVIPHQQNPRNRSRLTGFQVSPIVRYNSGQPFNVFAPSDLNGDHHSNDRPVGVGRDSGTGKNYADVDLRLSRAFKVTEGSRIQFMAEAFNLFNRRNYSSLNNTCGADPAGLNNCNPFLPPAQFRGTNAGLTGTSSPSRIRPSILCESSSSACVSRSKDGNRGYNSTRDRTKFRSRFLSVSASAIPATAGSLAPAQDSSPG